MHPSTAPAFLAWSEAEEKACVAERAFFDRLRAGAATTDAERDHVVQLRILAHDALAALLALYGDQVPTDRGWAAGRFN